MSDIEAAIPDPADFMAALGELPPGWWWSAGTCCVSNDASIGPDRERCGHKPTLLRFDDGLHADLLHPSTVADAIRDCIRQAKKAGVGEDGKLAA